MATARNTLGSAFGAIETTLDVITKTATALTSGADALSTMAETWSVNAKRSSINERLEHSKRVDNETAMRIVEQQNKVLTFIAKSPDQAKMFNSALAEIVALHNPAQ